MGLEFWVFRFGIEFGPYFLPYFWDLVFDLIFVPCGSVFRVLDMAFWVLGLILGFIFYSDRLGLAVLGLRVLGLAVCISGWAFRFWGLYFLEFWY